MFKNCDIILTSYPDLLHIYSIIIWQTDSGDPGCLSCQQTTVKDE